MVDSHPPAPGVPKVFLLGNWGTSEMRLSYSAIKTFTLCKRKYWLEYHLTQEPQEPSLPQAFGRAWHKAMDTWHTDRDKDRALSTFRTHFPYPGDAKRNLDTAGAMLDRYASQYASDTFKVEATELKFEIPVTEGISYVGIIDKLISLEGKIQVMEHKTTTWLDTRYLSQYDLSPQGIGYILGAQYSGYPGVNSVLYDIALVTRTKPREGASMLLRYPVEDLSGWVIEEFGTQVGSVARDIKRAEAENSFPPNWNACNQYGGCPFLQYCKSSPEAREGALNRFYKKKESHDEQPESA